MGQHKYNPNCQLAAEGKLPPKPKKMSKRQQERFLMKLIYEKTGIVSILTTLLSSPTAGLKWIWRTKIHGSDLGIVDVDRYTYLRKLNRIISDKGQ